MNAANLESGWLQQQTLDGINDIEIECDHLDLKVEVDESLEDMVQLVAQPAENGPTLSRSGSRLLIVQTGRYRGRVTPMLRLPAGLCPEIDAKVGRGDLSFQQVLADVMVRLGMGDVEIIDGAGTANVSVGKGDIAVVRRDGHVSAKLGMGDVALKGCSSNVHISSGKGDVAVAECGPDISIHTGNGDISVARATGGHLSVSSGGGDVSLSDGEASSVNVKTGKGDIASSLRLVVDPDSDVDPVIDDDEGFEMFGDDFDFDTEDFSFGDIQVEAGENGVRVQRGNMDILRLGPDGIRIRGSKREISLGPDGIRVGEPGMPATRPGRFVFETNRGDVSVAVPTDLSVRVEVLATGDVSSDVPLVGVGRPGPRGTVKRYVGVSDGTGAGPRTDVRVQTKRGDVRVRSMRVQPREQVDAVDVEDDIDREEQARVILEALARGELSINEAERLLQGIDSGD